MTAERRLPPFPTRRSYCWLAAAAMGFAIYVSIMPFEFQRMPLEEAIQEYQTILRAPRPAHVPRTNYLANILLFVPIGFGLSGALLADRARRLTLLPAAVPILAASVVLSLFVEFLQIFVPGRVPGSTDIEAQTIGCIAGIGFWAFAGTGLTAWLRTTLASERDDRLARALVAYGAVWVFVNLAPFDIALDPGELARRVRTGMITIQPFGGAATSSGLVWDAFVTFLAAVPLGAMGLVGWTGSRSRRDPRSALILGGAIVAAVEAAQIFIRSHAADTGDLLAGWMGVSAGVWLGLRTFARERREVDGVRRFSAPAAAAFLAWCLVLAGYHWMPYDFAMDTAEISRRLSRMPLLPFVGYHRGPDLNALNDLLVKLGVSLPLGLIASYVLPTRTGLSRVGLLVWVFVALAVFGAVEAGQLFLPSRVPGPGDVVTGAAGSTAGLWLGYWLQRGGDRQPAGGV